MAILCFIIPFITCLILYFGFRQAVVWWEYIAVVVPSILLTVILYFTFKSVGISDTEYLGYYVTKTCYYEPWNEYIHKTCTREVYDGTDDEGHAKYRTETYDCSYVDYHPAEWTMITNGGSEIYIDKDMYNMLVRKFGTPLRFVDMHRHYYTQDGDKYECYFNGDRNRMHTLTFTNTYKNKILRSRSIFNFSEVSERDKADYKLYDYPEDFSYKTDQNPIMSEIYVSKAVVDSFKYINAYYGGKYQFRVFVMIWKNAPLQTATLQQDYFVGGNKNELCVCISVDNMNNVQWVNTFSWEDRPDMAVGVNHLYQTGEKLDLMKLNRYLLRTVPSKWHRKAFADFDYINVMLTTGQWIVILFVILLFNVIIGIVVVSNDEYNRNDDGSYPHYHYNNPYQRTYHQKRFPWSNRYKF